MPRQFTWKASEVFMDWRCNQGNPRIQILLVLFRTAQAVRRRYDRNSPLSLMAAAIYRLYSVGACAVDIPVSTSVGRGLTINHGFGIVVNARATIGNSVVLRHGVTIGNRGEGSQLSPSIGDFVTIGAQATILGDISIGDYVQIGAHSLVLSDVASRGITRAPRTAVIDVASIGVDK